MHVYNEVQCNLITAISLMKTCGRARHKSYLESEGYCPLGAIAAAITGLRGSDVNDRAYQFENTAEIIAAAQAFRTEFNVAPYLSNDMDIFFANDQTDDDNRVFQAMQRAVEIAGNGLSAMD